MKVNRNQITIGSDPEFMVSYNGKPFSVIGKLGGSKKEPMDIGKGCGLQEDNVNPELTMPPVKNKEDFIKYINYGKQVIVERLKINTGLDCKVESWSSAKFSNEDLNNPVARTFGCEPSYCIYTGQVSPRPSPEDVGNIRSAGFHIHIGMPGVMNTRNRIFMIWCMDLFLGVPSLLIDSDQERRQLYGNAGDFRFKYLPEKDISIIEYRTLGAKMHETDELIGFVFDQTMKAVDMFLENQTFENFQKNSNLGIRFEEPKIAIDDLNYEIAEQLINITKTSVLEYVENQLV